MFEQRPERAIILTMRETKKKKIRVNENNN